MKISFDLPDEYPWIVLALILLCFEAVLVSMIVVNVRMKVFPKAFMQANF